MGFIQNKNRWFFILVLSFVYFVLVYYVFGFYFKTNDDASMLIIASGQGFVGTPSEYLLFMNVIIGYLLKELYQFYPDMPWYTLLELGALFVCFSYIFYLILSAKIDSLFVKAASVVFFLVIYSFFIVSLQYTMVASILTVTGYLTLFFDDKKNCSSRLIFIGFCFFSSALIRIHSFLLFQAFLLPAFLFYQCLLKSKIKSDYKIYLLLFIVFMLVGMANVFDRFCYRSHDSGIDWVEMNALTGKYLNYFSLTKESKKFVEKGMNNAGWTVNDVSLLHNWAYFDLTIFSKKKLKDFSEYFEYPKTIQWIKGKRFYAQLFERSLFSTSVLLMTLGVYLLWKIRLKEGVTMAVLVFLSSSFLFCLASFLKPAPPRVYWPVMFSYFVFSILFIFKTGPAFKKQKIKQLLYFILVCSLSFNLLRAQANYSEYRQKEVVDASQLFNIMNKLGKKYYITDRGMPLESIDVMSSHPFHDVFMITFGGAFHSPAYIDRLKQHRINSLGEQLLSLDTRFVSLKTSNLKYILSSYFREHFDTDVKMVQEAQIQEFEILRFEKNLH